jgi:holin-like protein
VSESKALQCAVGAVALPAITTRAARVVVSQPAELKAPVVGIPGKAKAFALVGLELAALWGLNQVGYLIVGRLHVPLPGNVAAMLVLFGLLCTGVVPVRMFERSSALLNRHLAFFFVPIAVGLMDLGGTLLAEGWILILVLIASASVGLCATGWIAQLLSSESKP